MSIDRNVLKAVCVIIAVLGFHLIPAFFMHLRVKRNKKKISRPIWKTYLVWFIIFPVLMTPLLSGYIPFLILCYILSLLLFQEFLQYTEIRSLTLLKITIQLTITIVSVSLIFSNHIYYYSSCVLGLIIIVTASLFTDSYKGYIQKISTSLYLYIYSCFLLSHLVLLRRYADGMIYVFIYFILIINNDAFSYICGFFFGKHLLVSALSPKKTVEGTLGGIVSVFIIGFILLKAFQLQIEFIYFLSIVLLIAIGGTLGDLAMSAVKRDLGIKDFGRLIPGHGGLIDRLDSSLLIAPAYYYMYIFLIRK